MITEDYVSFETAKLLKEKGFKIPYDSFRGVYINGIFKRLNPGGAYGYNLGDEIVDVCSLQMAMKWLREVHGLHIEIRITNHSISNLVDVIKYYWIVFGAENAKWKTESTVYTVKAFDKYEEAAEASIKYCLENLI